MIDNPNLEYKGPLNQAVTRKYSGVLKRLSIKQKKISCADLYYLLTPLYTHKRGHCSGLKLPEL